MAMIDPDDRRTWPAWLRSTVSDYACRLRDTTQYTSDLAIDKAEDDHFRSCLAPSLLRAYHATRLLPHEVEAIRGHGLRELTCTLIHDRIDAAHAWGVISAEECELFRTANVFDDQDPTARTRRGKVCLFLGQGVLNHRADGVRPLLTTWGGEGIYMSGSGFQLRPRLMTLGMPAIVELTVDLSEGQRTHSVYPGVLHCFVARVLRLTNVVADVHFRGPIAAKQIIDIWQPGDPKYDRHSGLPRATG